MDPKAKWESVQVGYVVSGRKDFIIGNIDLTNQPRQIKNGKEYSYSISLTDQLSSFGEFQHEMNAFPFISGITVNEPQFSFKFQKIYFNSSSKVLNLTTFADYKYPTTLSISFVLFHPHFDLKFSKA